MSIYNFTTYDAALKFLYNQLPMFQRQGPKALKYDLANVTKLVDALGNPHRSLEFIHVAGTNGKGSVCHYLSSILQEQGLKVGLYTSPHYKDYRERIRLNGDLIPKKAVKEILNLMYSHNAVRALKPTFFELTVAMAFQYFKEEQVDVVVLETGLGGRLDSTNIVKPKLSVITNIGLDHQATLGETMQEIAKEKAGIIKPKIPVLIGQRQVQTTSVFHTVAKATDSQLVFAEDFIFDEKYFNEVHIEYQRSNIQTCLAALTVLNKQTSDNWQETSILKGLQNVHDNTGYVGRWQTLSTQPNIIVDAAHNQAGMHQVSQVLKNMKYDRLHIVLGMVGDKPIGKVLTLLPKHAKYYFAKANVPRGKLANELQREAQLYSCKGKSYSSVRKALASAKLSAAKSDLILVTGSIFTVAEVI